MAETKDAFAIKAQDPSGMWSCLTASTSGTDVAFGTCGGDGLGLRAWKLCKAVGSCAPVDDMIARSRLQQTQEVRTNNKNPAAVKPTGKVMASAKGVTPAGSAATLPQNAEGGALHAITFDSSAFEGKAQAVVEFTLPNGVTVTASLTRSEPLMKKSGAVCEPDSQVPCPVDSSAGASKACSTWSGALLEEASAQVALTECGGVWHGSIHGLVGSYVMEPRVNQDGMTIPNQYYMYSPVLSQGDDQDQAGNTTRRSTLHARGRRLQQSSTIKDPESIVYLVAYVDGKVNLEYNWIRAAIANSVDITNAALKSANVDVTVRLLKVEKLYYSFVTANDILVTYDKFAAGVPSSFYDMKADHAMLIVPSTWQGAPNWGDHGGSLSVITVDSLKTHIFPHALGHNWGLKHNREDEGCLDCPGYNFAPWAYVPGHCVGWYNNWCNDWHYAKGVTSIMGRGDSPGCKDVNFIAADVKGACANVMEFGYDGFLYTITGVLTTNSPLSSTHAHADIPLGDTNNDPGRYLRENTLPNANRVTHSCQWVSGGAYIGGLSDWLGGTCYSMTQSRAVAVCRANGEGRWSTAASSTRPEVKCAAVVYFPVKGMACFAAAPSGYSSGLARYDALTLTHMGSTNAPYGDEWGTPQTWICPPPPAATQAVRIKAVLNNKVVEVQNGWTSLEGGRVQQWEDINQYPASRWVLRPIGDYFVVAANDDKCMEILDADVDNGALAQLAGCDKISNPLSHRLWKVVPNSDGTVLLRVKHSGKCLDNSGSWVNGQQMKQWTCDPNNANQKFRITPWDVPTQCNRGGWCAATNSVLGQSDCNNDGILDWICEDSNGNRGALVSGTCNYAFSTSVPTSVCPPYFNGPRLAKIKVDQNNKVVEVSNGRMTTSGAMVQQWTDYNQVSSARWTLYRYDSDYWSIRASDEYCLDVTGNKNKDGAPVHIWWCPTGSPGDSQLWKIDILADGTVMFRNKYSHKCLDNGGAWNDGHVMKQWACSPSNANQKFRIQSWN